MEVTPCLAQYWMHGAAEGNMKRLSLAAMEGAELSAQGLSWGGGTHASEQGVELRNVFWRNGLNLQSVTLPLTRVTHLGIQANLPFLHEEVHAQFGAGGDAKAGFDEKARGAQIAHTGNIMMRRALPIHPEIGRGDARNAPTGRRREAGRHGLPTRS